MDILKWFIVYILSVCFGITFFVYLMRFPFFLTNNSMIVSEYYINHFAINIPMDILFISIYLGISFGVARLLKYNLRNDFAKIWVIVLTVPYILTGFFWYIFTFFTPSSWFFSRWFREVKGFSILYDVFLISIVFFVMTFIASSIHLL